MEHTDAVPNEEPKRPNFLYRRMREHGVRSLNDREVLAVLLSAALPEEQAFELGSKVGDLVGDDLLALSKLNLFELMRVLTERQAYVVIAAMELTRRRRETPVMDRPLIATSREAFEQLHPVLTDLQHEEFWLLFLDRGNRLMSRVRMSEGGMHGTVADPKKIFKMALDRHASTIILAHNHPSGQLRPSTEDITLTKKLVECGRFLDIGIHDHLIIGHEGYYSFSDNGQL